MPRALEIVLIVIALWIAVSLAMLVVVTATLLFLSSAPDRPYRWRSLFARLHGWRPLGSDGIIYQRTAGCGLACYEMMLTDLGLQTDEADEDRFTVTPSGIGMTAIVDALAHRGVAAQGVTFDPVGQLRHFQEQRQARVMLLLDTAVPHGWLAPVVGPAWRLAQLASHGSLTPRHWVCLEGCSTDGVTLRDPLYGRTALSSRHFRKLWTGFAIVATNGAHGASGVDHGQ
jgi:ABC-type bacteriocin/lantibiotic exporter with double-glycine peptidase domain